MLKKDNRTKLLELFFNDPLTGFQLREISRKINLAPKSVKNYLEELENNNLIIKKEHRVQKYPIYMANRDGHYFKLLKKLNIIRRINESGLLDYINDKCIPDAIIMFGSASKGEDVSESDIDIYLQCMKKELKLAKYEKILERKVNILFEEDFNNLSEELRNNIINGYKLGGYLRIRWKA